MLKIALTLTTAFLSFGTPVTPLTRGLKSLNKASEKSWRAVFDSKTGRLKGLEDGALEFAQSTVQTRSQEFLRKYSQDLFGVPPEELIFEGTSQAGREKSIYHQKVNGLRVFSAKIFLVFNEGVLMRVRSDLTVLKPGPESPVLPVSEAEKRVQAGGKRALVGEPSLKTELIYYPAADRLVKAYQMTVAEKTDRARNARKLLIVNARDASIILSQDLPGG